MCAIDPDGSARRSIGGADVDRDQGSGQTATAHQREDDGLKLVFTVRRLQLTDLPSMAGRPKLPPVGCPTGAAEVAVPHVFGNPGGFEDAAHAFGAPTDVDRAQQSALAQCFESPRTGLRDP